MDIAVSVLSSIPPVQVELCGFDSAEAARRSVLLVYLPSYLTASKKTAGLLPLIFSYGVGGAHHIALGITQKCRVELSRTPEFRYDNP